MTAKELIQKAIDGLKAQAETRSVILSLEAALIALQ